VSYGSILSEEIARKMMRLVQSDWYQSLWPHVQIMPDQRSRAYFANTVGGERISNSIEGGILGRGGDITIIDDPQTRRGADSDAEPASSLQGMSDLSTRVTDPRTHAQVLIQQRLHVDDATNWAIENWKDAVHIMLPARFETARACPQDRRTYDGELLWPAVWTDEELRKIELGLAGLDGSGEALSPYAISGQLQQSPIPRGGGVINRTDWNIWPEETPKPEEVRRLPNGDVAVELPQVSQVILSIDTAYSEKQSADFSACIVFGVWSRRSHLVGNRIGAEQPWFAEGRWSDVATPEQIRQEIEDAQEQPRVVLMEACQHLLQQGGGNHHQWQNHHRDDDEDRCQSCEVSPPRHGIPEPAVQRREYDRGHNSPDHRFVVRPNDQREGKRYCDQYGEKTLVFKRAHASHLKAGAGSRLTPRSSVPPISQTVGLPLRHHATPINIITMCKSLIPDSTSRRRGAARHFLPLRVRGAGPVAQSRC
jgi:hypothetical protein